MLVTLLGACERDRDAIELVAPFNEYTGIGEVTAEWRDTGAERAAGGTALQAAEVAFEFRVDVRNRLSDPLFVRLAEFRLLDDAGHVLGRSSAQVECTLGPGATEGVLSGSVWIPKTAQVRGYRVTRFAVPLSQRGRALFREWRLQGRRGEEAAIDAEIEAYAATPRCVVRW